MNAKVFDEGVKSVKEIYGSVVGVFFVSLHLGSVWGTTAKVSSSRRDGGGESNRVRNTYCGKRMDHKRITSILRSGTKSKRNEECLSTKATSKRVLLDTKDNANALLNFISPSRHLRPAMFREI